jgi:hypothetical protein
MIGCELKALKSKINSIQISTNLTTLVMHLTIGKIGLNLKLLEAYLTKMYSTHVGGHTMHIMKFKSISKSHTPNGHSSIITNKSMVNYCIAKCGNASNLTMTFTYSYTL